jgi:hypothetical protein
MMDVDHGEIHIGRIGKAARLSPVIGKAEDERFPGSGAHGASV